MSRRKTAEEYIQELKRYCDTVEVIETRYKLSRWRVFVVKTGSDEQTGHSKEEALRKALHHARRLVHGRYTSAPVGRSLLSRQTSLNGQVTKRKMQAPPNGDVNQRGA